MNNIFDTHAHYCSSAFDNDRDELLKTLPENGIKYVMLASYDMPSIFKNDEISVKYDYIYMAAGIHPNDIESAPDNYLDKISNIIKKNPKVKAIGEIGLDYHYEGCSREKQTEIFKRQIEFAQSIGYPVIVHSRDAMEDTMKILSEYKPSGVMHCFSGSAETAREIVKLGMYISFTGVLTFKNARKAVEALAIIPNDRFMLETDCPYMSPEPFRHKRCDSTMIPYIAQKAAEIKGITVQEILDITCSNAIKLFLPETRELETRDKSHSLEIF